MLAAMLIYKVLRAAEWAAFDRDGGIRGAPVDLADGFIHFSTAEQLPETLARHFAGEADLMLLAVDAARAGDALRWEPARGGALFPHLYRPVGRADMLWSRPLDGATAPPDLA
jgi:uncharacterized protein (DUF952 family)